MQKIYFLLFILSFVSGFTQSVNLINPADNAAYPAQQYFCTGESFNLKVDAVATSTGDYQMTSVLPSAFPLSAGSIPVNFPATGSNKFSEAFPIGFTFSFYGKNYTKVVMGSNGRLVFTNNPELEDLKDVNTYIDRTYSGISGYNSYSALPSTDYNKVYRTNPAQELNVAQIFFGYTDLVPRSQNSSVTYLYKNVTVGGVNGLIVSFQNQIRTNGTGGISSSRYFSNILLLEDGRIVIYVNNKTEDTYNAILGIQNEDASKFKVPTHSTYNYNNGPWKSEGNAWLFTPDQNLTPTFKWYQNSTLLSETSDTLNNFTPNADDVLKVEVTFYDSSEAQVGTPISDQVTFKKVNTPVIEAPIYSTCGNPAILRVNNPDPSLLYEWYNTETGNLEGTGNSIQVGTGKYYVQVKNTAGTCILKSTEETVNISSSLPPFISANKIIYKCDESNLASQTFNLATVTGYPTGSGYSFYFTESGSTTPITTINLNSGQTKNFTLHATTNSGVTPVCSLTSNFSISYLSFPENNKVLTSNKLCDNVTTYTTTDFKNTFYPGSAFNISFSTDGANFSNNPVNPKANNLIYVKLTAPDFSCESVISLKFDIQPPVIANQPDPNDPNLQQCASSTQMYDLHALFDNQVNTGNVTISYHTTLAGAKSGDNSVPNASAFRSGMGDTSLYIRVVDNLTSCVSDNFPTITLYVYNTPKFKNPSGIRLQKCEGEDFNLTQNIADLLESVDPKINYVIDYLAENGTKLTKEQYENYDPAVFGFKPKIQLKYNPTCSGTAAFNLSYYQKPAAILSELVVCEELNYLLTSFQNSVITNSSQYIFTDEFGGALPTNFDVSALPKTVKFLIKDKATGCVSDVQTVTFIKGTNTLLLVSETDFVLCDTDFDGKTSFDLNVKKTVFSTDPNAVFEYFKNANFTQPIAENYTNETAFAQTVYVRITVPGFCPSLGKINLKVNTPTKSSTLESKYYICFGETVTIDAGPENPARTWSTGETSQTIAMTNPGNYSVELTNSNECTYTHNFIVSDENQPKIGLINQTNNSIEVIASGGATPYLYYFNGVGQTSPVLMNPTENSHTVQVESATGCLGEPKTIYFIKIHNAFSPNGDGINDTWTIENLDKMESYTIQIVDRYGNKVFESQNKNNVVWDGKSNGRALPTGTYWYNVVWFDALTQKSEQRQGWVLLKNRN